MKFFYMKNVIKKSQVLFSTLTKNKCKIMTIIWKENPASKKTIEIGKKITRITTKSFFDLKT